MDVIGYILWFQLHWVQFIVCWYRYCSDCVVNIYVNYSIRLCWCLLDLVYCFFKEKEYSLENKDFFVTYFVSIIHKDTEYVFKWIGFEYSCVSCPKGICIFIYMRHQTWLVWFSYQHLFSSYIVLVSYSLWSWNRKLFGMTIIE